MARYRVETISVRCAGCGEPTPKDIVVQHGVQVYFHRRSHRSDCRIIVRPELDGTGTSMLAPDGVEAFTYVERLISSVPSLREHHIALTSAYAP